MASLKLHGISKRFGTTEVLKRVDLDIIDGEFLTLVGPSGCGKSTLLRVVAGLEEQTKGSVVIGERVVDKVRPSERDLAMVFQSYALYPHLSVADNIAVPLRMRWLSRWQRLPLARWLIPGTRSKESRIAERTRQASEVLGLQDLLDRKPSQLSGGQRQRVAVGRAIVRDPDAFLFDEPLSNLDAKLRVHMRAEITQLHRKLQSTFIYVTHDQAEAMTMSDRIAVMMDGELIQIGTPNEVYLDPRDVRVAEFIGSPKINLFRGEVTGPGVVQIFGTFTGLTVGESSSDTVHLGVRPENLRLAEPGRAVFSGEVRLLENLGAEVFVHIEVAGHDDTVVLRLTHALAQGVRLGDRVFLDFAPEHALVFDIDGRRLDAVTACANAQPEAARRA
ncbi:ABC transporter ATP-binding protein [Thiosocius teredinicola]|uniref:ABC transporter ATP-binding protein n=1 Tax=Thiosocius teredinicola TaxID=1973002 RepID=UPI000990AC39